MTEIWLPEEGLLSNIRCTSTKIVGGRMVGIDGVEIGKEMTRDNDREIEKE